MLITSAPIYFSGGMTTFLTAAYRFVVLVSTGRTRRIRLMLVMFSLTIGMAIGRFLGGQLLKTTDLSDGSHKELRSYWFNYAAGFLLDAVAIVMLFLTIKFVRREEDPEGEESEVETGVEEVDVNRGSIDQGTTDEGGNLFKKIFDIDNVKETLSCLTKPRPNQINLQIYSIYVTYFLMYFVYLGMQAVQLQFSEKVYNWSSAKYSNALTIQLIVSNATVSGSVILFIKCLKLRDSLLIVCTLGCSALAQFLIGSILKEFVFFATLPLGEYFILTIST